MAGVIPKEQLAAYQRWQANAFDAPNEVVEAPAEPPLEAAEVVEEEQGEAVAGPLNLPTADEIEQIHEQARQEGYQAGYEEGLQAAAAAMQTARDEEIARLRALIENFQQSLGELDQAVGEQTLDLALEVASLVLGSTLAIRRDLLLPIVREALQALPLHHGNLALHANPEDLEALRAGLVELGPPGSINLVPDSTLSPGGCLLKAGHSEIDATLETRWKRVLEAIGVEPEKWLIR
ncbi:MAG: flagellar assembly protein FliH [Dechloromonas sp.]|uniref:flagellar assembly protein FliH n=1 Tax=Azonexus hydrophilus TaxID=418702 RepID=UPI00041A3F17|nr:flagellar assembly protein FliH [Azonexus hydrophilus]MCA1937696.1 flagellar assembly protein FliH [Dechloromonas sp.]